MRSPLSGDEIDATPGKQRGRQAFIAFMYTITHGLALLNRGLFWDDWVFWRQDMGIVTKAAEAMGSTWPASINRLFYYSQWGITFNRALTFFSLLIVALLLFDIVRRVPRMDVNVAMWIAVVFAVFPAFESRIALVMVGYPVSVLMFVGALWLLVRYGPHPPIAVRLLAAALFFTSFHIGSLLVFFAVVPVTLLVLYPPTGGLSGVARRLAGYADQMAMPFVYWIVTRLWFQPTGLYTGYNTPGTEDGFFTLFLTGMWHVLSGPFLKAPVALTYYIPIVLAVIVAGIVALAYRKWPIANHERWLSLVLVGIVLLALAIIPYAAVGKAPGNGDWDTRHQLLVPFGWAFLFVGIVKAFMGRRRAAKAVGVAVLALAIGASVATLVNSYVMYQRDWLKQEALMVVFARHPEIEASHYLLIDDETLDWDYTQNRLFYEYAGILTETFGDQSRVGVLRKYYFGPEGRVSRYHPYDRYYKLGDFPGGPPDLLVDIKRVDERSLRHSTRVLRLMILDWVDRDALREAVGSSITIETRPWTPEEDRRAARHLLP